MSAFILMEIRKEANMWRIHASDHPQPIDQVVSQAGAIKCVKSIHAATAGLPIQLLVYDGDGRLQEGWAFKDGSERKLEIALPR